MPKEDDCLKRQCVSGRFLRGGPRSQDGMKSSQIEKEDIGRDGLQVEGRKLKCVSEPKGLDEKCH